MKLRELRMGLKVMLLVVMIGLVSLTIHETRSEEQSDHVNNTKVSTTLVEADADTEEKLNTDSSLTDVTGEEDSDEREREHLDTEPDDTETSDEVVLGEMNGNQAENRLTSVEETEGETIPITTFSLPATGGTVLAGETVVIDQDITGNITVNGGTLILNDNYTITGTVFVNNGGSFEMSDGLITGSSRGVDVSGTGSTFEMSGNAVISSNTGDGVRVTSSATFEMTGNAVVSDNTGDGVWVSGTGSTFEMTGDAVISDNSSRGVSVSGSATFEMTGDAVISNNHTGVSVSGSSTFEMTGDAVISDNSSTGVSVSGSSTFEMTGDAVISDNSSTGVSVSGSSTFEMTGDVVISNNHTGVSVSGSATFEMKGDAVISDNSFTGVSVSGTGSTFEMKGDAVISDNSSTGVRVSNSATFEMKGDAVISDNRDGVSVSTSATFEMKGDAVISDNTREGVSVSGTGSTFEMTGDAVISDNSSTGVSVSGSSTSFEMSGNAVISNNTTMRGAGGVQVSNSATFEMTGNAAISDNTSELETGGVRVANASFEMSDNAVISDNTGRDGGGIFVANNGTFTAISGSIINNTTDRDGGGIHTATFQYADPLTNASAYSNLAISEDVVFSGNTAGNGSFFPPSNATTFLPNIETTSTSIAGISHPLNNYDINFRFGSPIVHHTVSFNLHGGADEADFPTQTVLDGELADEPSTNPTRTGYTFEGWFTSSTGNTTFDFDTPITADTVIHAQWEEITTGGGDNHTVTFNLHGGADEADFPPQTVLDGELADEPSTNPTRTGYTFEGWFTSSTGNTTFDFDTPITADTVIHAQWEEITTGSRDNHAVTFNLHGGADEADFPPQTVLHGELADEPATNPTRTGYTFEGWFTSSTGNTTFDFDNPITADTVIHAQWEEITTGSRDNHAVTFNLHGGADEADFPTQTVLHGELADEPSTNPTRTGYTFEGWFTSSTGNTIFDFDNPITADTVIHAQWEEITTGGEDNNENNNNNTHNRRLPRTGAVTGSVLGIGGVILIIGLVIAKKKKLKD